jgi:hypothetical protein
MLVIIADQIENDQIRFVVDKMPVYVDWVRHAGGLEIAATQVIDKLVLVRRIVTDDQYAHRRFVAALSS